MPHTGNSGQSGGTPVTPGDVYISSSISIKGVQETVAAKVFANYHEFLELFIPTLLTKNFTGGNNQFNPGNNENSVPARELANNISFSQYTDFMYPFDAPFKGKTYLHLENKSKRVLLRRDKSKKKMLLGVAITPTPVPFEIQIRSNNSTFIAPNTLQVDFILFYLAKVGYANDSVRVAKAFEEVYIHLNLGPKDDVNDLAELEINFTAPVQIGVNDRNCGGYTIPGSDKRTAIAVLHDKVECLAALINDISGGNAITGPILPQYVAYDHGLVTDLENETLLAGLPTTPVDWNTWYGLAANNPTSPLGSFNDMTGPNKSNTNLKNWILQGKVLVFRSPLGAGTLSIYLSGFPFPHQEEPLQSGEDYPEAKDGAFIRLCNGNNPYDASVNEYNGNSAYDDRFIFYDQYYRVLANITPGESVRVTWCSTQATPGWISIVGT